ncbi:MAG: ankyrin repeat domain-containing protein [Burkholderiales bacterium]
MPDMTWGDYLFAIHESNTVQVNALLDAGQDPFEGDSDGNGLFFWASFRGDAEMVQAIADAPRKTGGIKALSYKELTMALPKSCPLDAVEMRRFEVLV